MEHNIRFGLIFGQLAILKKKIVPIMSKQLLRPVFSCFRGQKQNQFF